MRRVKKGINKGIVALKCIVMTFVWTAVFYGAGYGAVVGIEYLATHFTFDQLIPWIWLILLLVMCGAYQCDKYDHIVYPEKYKDNKDED